ncbi:MAG: diguanylate cyclase [Deltaproteobacteria bacterium]|nr:diguanylate cyclase [Deltaproteobacteria bacterium]
MDQLVTSLVTLRRGARRALPLGAVALLGALVVWLATEPPASPATGAVLGLGAALFALRAWRRRAAGRLSRTRGQPDPEPLAVWRDLELGALLVVAAYALVLYLDGSLAGPSYPLTLVAVAVVGAFARLPASLGTMAVGLGLHAAVLHWGHDALGLRTLGPHAGFLVVFGLLNVLSLRIEVARLRRAAQEQLVAERQRVRDEARRHRLLQVAPDGPCEGDAAYAPLGAQERLLCSSIEQIELSTLLALRLLRQGLGAHTAMLLWLEPGGDELVVGELVSDDPELAEGPFSVRDGIFGAALARSQPVCVSGLKPSYILPYYQGACPVRALCAVPVAEHGRARGVLVVDRTGDRPFAASEQELCEQAASFAVLSAQNERVFAQLDRTKAEQGKLYRAAQALGAATTEQQVVDAAVASAREIAAVDFAAFTLFDPEAQAHQICAVSGERAEPLVGQRFPHASGLVSMVVRNGQALPYRGEYDAAQHVVFDRNLQPPDLPSLVVLPLVVHEQPLGTLVLGSRRRGAFGDAARGLLEVLASHVAVSLSNARMVRRLAEQATTDGMTGLLNKRALVEAAELKISAARRFGRRLSLVLCDLDHFKCINDTHGHDVGDMVIKELGRIQQRARRGTDAAGRFGGEEFVVVCEETDARGALLLAERIRAELGQTTFHAAAGPVRCTCSVGIATYPDAGTSWEELFKAADAALYHSKRTGRDKATVWSPALGQHAAA